MEINFENFSPEEGKIVVVRFPLYSYTPDEVGDIFQLCKKRFPHNELMFLPNDFTLGIWTKKELQEMISNLSKQIERMPDVC